MFDPLNTLENNKNILSISIYNCIFEFLFGELLHSVPAWAKEPVSAAATIEAKPIDPEDMSKDRTNEFLTICRSIGTNQVRYLIFNFQSFLTSDLTFY